MGYPIYCEFDGRVNEFNIEDLLRLFLPYHDSPHFTKMVTILHIKYEVFSSSTSPCDNAIQMLLFVF